MKDMEDSRRIRKDMDDSRIKMKAIEGYRRTRKDMEDSRRIKKDLFLAAYRGSPDKFCLAYVACVHLVCHLFVEEAKLLYGALGKLMADVLVHVSLL